MVIKPTVGRVVWFHPAANSCENDFVPAPICAAQIAFVHSDSCVNLGVLDKNGVHHSKTNVLLIQEGETPPDGGYYCEWMPYQKDVASGKHPALQHATPM